MVSTKRIALALGLIAGFVMLAFLTVFTYFAPQGTAFDPLLSFFARYHFELMLMVSAFGLLVGAGVFYLMSGQVDRKGKEARATGELLLRFLSPDERAVVKELLRGGGKILQAEVGRLPGMTRLKAHRIVLKMADRGVIEVTKSGKLNVVYLKGELKAALLGDSE
ncbi:MAG: hypothetical protein V1708_06095 [Candidatus Micrarchaeota archaeon]